MALPNLGPYRTLERLGAGAYGEVLLAEDTRLHRQVAIKTLSSRVGSDTLELRRRVLREARAAARLNHPHIAAVYDVVELDAGIHIVMEYVPGATLASRVRAGPLPAMEVLHLGIQLSSALAHAHSLGVIHRDIKPGNIVITNDGQAKILDFGLARLHGGEASSDGGSIGETSAGRRVVGTPPYIPPEHLDGEAADARGDIYSLGVTLYELLTGRHPFQAGNGMSLVTAIQSAPTPRPRSLSPDIPMGLDEIVFRAMARAPGERFATAATLESELRHLSSSIADSPTRSHALMVRKALPRAAKGSVAVAAALAVATSLYVASGRGVPGRSSPVARAAEASRPVVAVLPLAGANGDPATESLGAGVADALITALARVPGLTVVSRSATLKYRDRGVNVDTIARELGATLLVDGTVQRSGDNLRLTVAVLQAGSNAVRWQAAYDGRYSEVLTLQKEVANAVAGALRITTASVAESGWLPTANVEAFAEYSQARSFLERPDIKDNLDLSITLFQGAIAKDGAFARAHAGLGEAYWRKFETTRKPEWTTQARDEITEALRLDPADMSVRQSLASIYRGLGRADQAIDELRRVTAAQPGADEAHRLLGQLLIEKGRYDDGVAEIREAIRLRPQYWAHHATLGQSYFRAGRFREAIPAFERVTQLQPDSAWGYQMLGATFHSMDDTAHAIAPYQKAIALGNAKAHANLGLVYFDLGRIEEALTHFEAAARIDPSSPLKHHNVGDALSRLGRAKEARVSYRRAAALCREELSVRPDKAPTLATLAIVESKLGATGEADRDIKRAVSLAPDDAEVRYAEAVVDARSGRADQAVAALAAAVSAGYSPLRARKDPELVSLKTHPSFAAALEPPKGKGGRT